MFQFTDGFDDREITKDTSVVYSYLMLTSLISTKDQRNVKTQHQGASRIVTTFLYQIKRSCSAKSGASFRGAIL